MTVSPCQAAEGAEAGTAGAAPVIQPFYGAVRSGIWPLGPGFRREDGVKGAADAR
ncbi:hypothetical protein [Niveispirillum fermenti]|uniref:hypothetical protein n=1 Tax=Niveispirillum fermenti TaxID=1233113 RepID=UPI003A8C594D